MKKNTKLTPLLLPLVPLSAIGIVEVAGSIARPAKVEAPICEMPAPITIVQPRPEPPPAPAPDPTPAPVRPIPASAD